MLLPEGADLTDGQLLECFVSRRDEAALAALVRRHGPMVWGVCRRVLGNHHDAEDAFQATFLVLVRKAASIAPREMVGNWLYGVAHQTAFKARATAAKQRTTGKAGESTMPEPAVTEQDLWRPATLARPGVEPPARQVSGRHRPVRSGGQDPQGGGSATRLARRDGGGSAGEGQGDAGEAARSARAGGVGRGVGGGAVPEGGVGVRADLGGVFHDQGRNPGCGGENGGSGLVSVKVAALTEGVLKAMLLTQTQGGYRRRADSRLHGNRGDHPYLPHGGGAGQAAAAEKPVETPQKQEKEKEKEAFTAWGKEVGGLQAGLGFRPGEQRAYPPGETVTLVVRVRNVGKEEVKFQYRRQFFLENPPAVTDGKGKPIPLERDHVTGFAALVAVNLAPGKEIEVGERKLELKPTLYRTGKFNVQYEQLETPENDKALSKLATGKLELEVKDAEKLPEPDATTQKEFTSWGKEVGGLQAGLGFRAREKRVYTHGETVTLVVRLRNVGKQNVKLQCYYPYFIEIPPTITDGKGKPFVIEKAKTFGLPVLDNVELAAGNEIQLAELKFNLKPAPEKGVNELNPPGVLKGTGKFQIHYRQLAYEGDLGKLDTGKLELEVREPERMPPEKEALTAWGKEVGGLQAGLCFSNATRHSHRWEGQGRRQTAKRQQRHHQGFGLAVVGELSTGC